MGSKTLKNPAITTVTIFREDLKRLHILQRPNEYLRDVVKRALDALEEKEGRGDATTSS